MFSGSALGVLYTYFTKGVLKKHDDLVGVVPLDILGARFICCGKQYKPGVNPKGSDRRLGRKLWGGLIYQYLFVKRLSSEVLAGYIYIYIYVYIYIYTYM